MRIPKIISKNNREYILAKEYPNFIMYKDMITGVKVNFKRQELGLVKPTNIMRGVKRNPDKVKI